MRVVIVEDSDRLHATLHAVVRRCAQAQPVGRAVAEAEAIELILREQPDLVLLDLALRPGSGLAVLRAIRDRGCAARVLVVTGEAHDAMRLRCLQAGADGFYDKVLDLHAIARDIAASASRAAAPLAGGFDASPATFDDCRARLGRIAERAAGLTGRPMAAVTLLDGTRQWLAARVGPDLSSTSRQLSFCTHTLAARALVEVRDATRDKRFRANPSVQTPPGVRYYAGAPLVMPTGEAIGTLYVLDTVPHQLDEPERAALQALAAEAAVVVERMRGAALIAMHGRGVTGEGPVDAVPDRALALALACGRDGVCWAGAVSLDIEGFTGINHAFGRAAGDVVLEEVGRRVAVTCPRGGIAARTGGDEFAVFVPGPADEQALAEVADALVSAVSRPIDLDGRTVRLRCSIGMAAVAKAGSSPHGLLGHAELAVRHAKQGAGGLRQFYAPWMGARAVNRITLDAELRAGIGRGELTLEYQPQRDLATGRLTGVEALVRWRHPERGLLMPDAFIGIAESSDLIVELGAAVLDLAIAQIAAWRTAGLEPPRVAVNVSALQLTPALVDTIARTLRRHGVPAAGLEIELTESTLPCSGTEAIAVLHALREVGLQVAVDDFGTGYSSLTMLQRLPVSTLKIDRDFVAPPTPSGPERAIVAAVVSIARVLGLRTVAEGVETPDQADCLRALGCDQVQGYLFGRPAAPAAIAGLLRQARPRSPHPDAAHAALATGDLDDGR